MSALHPGGGNLVDVPGSDVVSGRVFDRIGVDGRNSWRRTKRISQEEEKASCAQHGSGIENNV